MTHDEAKKKILARRARFLAIAMASTGLASTQGCGGSFDRTDPLTVDGGSDASTSDASYEACLTPEEDGGVQVCLSQPYDGGYEDAPEPCLDPPFDAEPEAAVCLQPYDGGYEDAPEPCLSPPEDSGPEPCLTPIPEDGGEPTEDAG